MALLQLRRKKKHRSKWVPTIRLLIVAVILFAGWKAMGPAKQKYRGWKQQRALAQAKVFIEKNDPANAQIALELALSTSPNSPDAWRLAADMLEQVGAPQAMRLRRRVVEMVPDSVEDRAKLILSTLQFKDMNAARDAISAMTVEQGSKLPALRAQLAYALITDNAPIADALYDRIHELAPNNDSDRISHAVLSLRSPRTERVDKARAELIEFAKNPKYRMRIHREFFNEALLRKNLPEASRWATENAADADAAFADKVTQANMMMAVDKKSFEEALAYLKPLVSTDYTSMLQFSQWLMTHGKLVEAQRWIDGQNEDFKKLPGVLSMQAEIAAAQGNWTELATYVERGAWGPIKPETVRLAMSARLVQPELRAQIWEETMRSANSSLGTMRVLQRLASSWGWEAETERTLWSTLRMYPDQTWIHQLLFNTYRGRKDAESMRNVLALLREAEPTVARYQHDWALLSLLTDPRPVWNQPKETLKQLASDHPDNPSFAMSYAFALAQAGRGPEALAVVERMSAQDRSLPERAPYLAYVYGVNRRKTEMESFSQLESYPSLLKEERRLFTLARDAANRKTDAVSSQEPARGKEP